MRDHQIILHHYPESPVSEKVRVVLGIKGLSWKSVIIPRLPPKPNLMPLTGGYRQTPVMQIGADIYCDTMCIIQEIETRFPSPTLFPAGTSDLAWGLSQWTDGPLFQDVVTVGLVEMSTSMPPEFLADRGALYFGKDFSLDNIKSRYAECLANVRTQYGWMEKNLQSSAFMAGEAPGLPDALCYYLVWFLMDRMADADQFMQQLPNLLDWAQRVRDIGHGTWDEMSDLDALAIATESQPQMPTYTDTNDPLGLNIGDAITVESANGSSSVTGNLHSLSTDHVALIREDDQVGTVCVHFPRLGYSVSRQ